MPEGLEVVIKYKDLKYIQVNSPNLSHSKEIAILKTDLAHLRVHSPAQKNVRRHDGSFILHWPTAGTSPKVEGLADSLHMRWFKLCSNDPDALKLREFLSIESITLTQDGLLLRSTDNPESNEGLLAILNETEQPTLAPAPHAPKAPPTAPRSDRLLATHHHHHLKRKMSNADGPPPTRPKLDTTRDTPPHLGSTSPRGDQRHPPFDRVPTSAVDVDVSPTTLARTQSPVRPHTPLITQRSPTPAPEPGEVTPLPGTPTCVSTPTVAASALQAPLTFPVSIPPTAFIPLSESAPSPVSFDAPLPARSTTRFSASSPVPLSNSNSNSALAPSPTASRPPALALAAVPPTGSPILAPRPRLSPVPVPAPVAIVSPPTGPRLSPHPHPHPHPHPRPRPRTTSPHPNTQTQIQTASPNSHGHGHGSTNASGDPSRRRDVQRLTRELWDTRRQLTAVQAREQVVLDDLERLGARPEGAGSGAGSGAGAGAGVGAGAGLDRSSSRDELLRLETELRAERTRRIRAEGLLTDVERECRAPFVVPALFQAFVAMSELAS